MLWVQKENLNNRVTPYEVGQASLVPLSQALQMGYRWERLSDGGPCGRGECDMWPGGQFLVLTRVYQPRGPSMGDVTGQGWDPPRGCQTSLHRGGNRDRTGPPRLTATHLELDVDEAT